MNALNPSVKSKSPLHEILVWSNNRPEWQRDALRRIIENGQISIVDTVELEKISRSAIKHPSVKPAPIKANPLTSAHLPSAPGAAESVSLVSLSALKGVNQLPHGSDLPLGTSKGLTIIFGKNGAGKTSYARVIKKACRARGSAPDIMPNVFGQTSASIPASATITFRVGSNDVPVSWKNGVATDPRLANVFVFDSSCAEHYISTDSSAAFTPYGLDVLPALSKICDDLAARLKTDIGLWNGKISGASANWKYDPTTKVGQIVQALSKTTKDSEINTLATLSQAEAQRLLDLRNALKADPLQKARETRAAVSRLESFAKKVNAVVTELADDKIEAIRAQLESATTLDAAAKAFAAGQFDSTYLPGTGSELWRALWNAAKQYSESEAYPGGEFPLTSDDANCVLCQQEIDESTGLRFSHFNEFCKDKSQQLAAEAEQALSKTISKVNITAALKPELDKIDADLATMIANERLALSEFTDKADALLLQIKQNLLNKSWVIPVGIPGSPETSIRNLMSNLEARANTEASAHDPDTRKKLQAELKELESREWLAGVKADVLQQIERYKIVAELEDCEKDLKTSAITAKSTELTDLFVTQAFKTRFKDEVDGLQLTTLDVVMEPVHGKKGVTNFGLRLVKASNAKVADIASEGERRCVALAAFMAELSQASHESALVFDDPVSSLDHSYREKIAKRLADEASKRQVIVFTHDEIFMNDLLSFADSAKATAFVLTVEWDNGAPGKYTQGLPWDSQQPLSLLQELDKEQKGIAAHWNPQPNQTNIAEMRQAYSRLRSALERIIEVELLADVVRRFRSHVKSGYVDKLEGITSQEIAETKRLLKKCHDLTEAHAPSTVSIPTPANLTQDISDARQLVATIRSRKKTL
jgi:energy-coupling factor transporter ATP-binding protein EcfA2